MGRPRKVVHYHYGRKERQDMALASFVVGAFGAVMAAVLGYSVLGGLGGIIGFFVGGALGSKVCEP